ncbi:MAG: STAS domain-containing protein [Granulosicoccus sp.]
MSSGVVQVVELPSHFSQVQLAGLKAIVDHHVVDGEIVQFDAQNLERIDGAAVQFLLALSLKQAAADEPVTVVVNSNEVLTNALDDMGMSDLIKTEVKDSTSSEISPLNE